MYKCVYFSIKELVSKIVYDFYKPTYGEDFLWRFFDADILKDLDTIRKEWDKPIIINNWSSGGNLSQCGIRSNLDPLVKQRKTPYLGGHNLAKGFDLHDSNGNNEGLYNCVKNLIISKKLKKIRRLENFKITKTWVHADALQTKNDDLEIF